MRTKNWQLENSISAIVFDCDGTLSAIEGVNELAKHKGVEAKVALLTEKAMGATGLNADLYQERLNLIKPHRNQVLALGHEYYAQQAPDAKAVIALLARLNKSIYVVSAGLQPAVAIFAEQLEIPKENIYAVNITFDREGNFLEHDKTSPLIHNHGKKTIVTELMLKHATLLHIGDGLNDYVTHDIVTRFIGYGGIYQRENLASTCEYYINTPSLSSLLPLTLTTKEYEKLNEQERVLYEKGLHAIRDGRVKA